MKLHGADWNDAMDMAWEMVRVWHLPVHMLEI